MPEFFVAEIPMIPEKTISMQSQNLETIQRKSEAHKSRRDKTSLNNSWFDKGIHLPDDTMAWVILKTTKQPI